jgi:hypothetical protein
VTRRVARRRARRALPLLALLALGGIAAAGCTTGAQPPPARRSSQRAATEAPSLPRELRRKVERLREEAKTVPTDAQNVYARADVVWEWGNALALAGLPAPPDLPSTIGMIRLAQADGGEVEPVPQIEMPMPLQIRRLDRYIEELGLLQDGKSVGELRFEATGPFASRDWVTIEQTYTVGEVAIEPGGAFVLGVAGTGQEGRPQHGDGKAPNFVTVRASRDGATFERIEVPWNGVHASIGAVVDLPAFRVAGATLEPGDTVTFTYGDRTQGSSGLQVPTFASDRWLLPIYVDVDGTGDYYGLRWPALEIVGRPEVHAVRLLGPSVVERGETFSVVVRSEDDAINRASGPTPAYEVLLAGEVVGSVAAGRTPFATVGGLAIDQPGVHRLEVRSADGKLHAVGNPVRVEEEVRQRVLWGDTHGHTGFAEGQGSPRAYFEYATEDARLDFATLSEHDMWLDDGEWRTLQELAREFSSSTGARAGSAGRRSEGARRASSTPAPEARPFVGILGYEWSAFTNRGGHHNVFFRDPASERVGLQIATRLPDLYRELHARFEPDDVLVIPHAHRSGDWTQSDADLERLVELYSVHGSFEWFANMYLKNGFELGFVAASDDHMAKPGLAPAPISSVAQPGGLAAVFAPEATTDAIFASLRALRSYATSGQRILLDATVNGKPMGTRQAAADRREIRFAVAGTSPIDHIDVVRNGDVIHSRSYLTAQLEPESTLQVAFESSSEVFGPAIDNPRGIRVWRGTLEVEGATLRGARRTGLDNPLRDRLEWDAAQPQTVKFAILTRGRADSILLDLEGAGPQTKVRIELEATKEAGAASTIRPLHDVPAATVELALDRLENGRLVHAMPPVGEHVDRIALQVVDDEAPLDRELEYVDLDAAGGRSVSAGVADTTPGTGDYYYVRVTQLDGGRAWTSPFWVGGERATDGRATDATSGN